MPAGALQEMRVTGLQLQYKQEPAKLFIASHNPLQSLPRWTATEVLVSAAWACKAAAPHRMVA